MRRLILLLLTGEMLAGAGLAQTSPVMLPYSPGMMTDSKGHEWYVEQNGSLQRQGDSPSMIGSCAVLQIAGQTFYSQQAQVTPDGREMRMTSPQAMGGVNVTRTLTLMDREGALRYVEELTNTTARDLSLSVELRHGFGGSAREVVSDLGRVFKDGLTDQESGIAGLPQDAEGRTSALLILARSPRSMLPLKIRVQNKYQVSITCLLTLAAGETCSLVHALAQVDLPPSADAARLGRAFAPLRLDKLAKSLPKSVLKTAVNLGGPVFSLNPDSWFPKDCWGMTPTGSDQLALGKGSLLKGRVEADSIGWSRGNLTLQVPRERVAAVSGPAFTGDGRSWIWLRDGQRWLGAAERPEWKFVLNNSAELPVKNLDRLVFARSSDEWRKPEGLLIELASGERLSVVPSGDVALKSEWGKLVTPWAGLLACQKPEGTEGGLFFLRSGSRVRARFESPRLKVKTTEWGEQEIAAEELCRLIAPAAELEEEEPVQSYLDLVEDQRLVGRVTASSLTLLTEAGPLKLSPSLIRELREVGEEDAEARPRVFEADLWGGGVVRGPLQTEVLPVEGEGFRWELPVRQVVRLVNPVPVTDATLMRRIGQLVQELGHDQWKVREAATNALREMGPLAHAGLREALKSATDAEVVRRLEELLQDQGRD
jgi:hypothetical protein